MAYSPLRPVGGSYTERDHVNMTVPKDADFRRGMRSAIANQSAMFGADEVLRAEAGGATKEEIRPQLESALRSKQQAELYAPRMQSLENVGGVGDLVDFIQGGAPQAAVSMAPSLATALLTRGRGVLGNSARWAGAATPAYLQERGETALGQYTDPTLSQASVEDRDRAASTKGVANAMLESIVPASLAKAGFKAGTGGVGKQILKNSGVEALTETAQTYTGHLADKYLDESRELNPWHLADAAALGAIGGGGMTAGMAGAGATARGVKKGAGIAADYGLTALEEAAARRTARQPAEGNAAVAAAQQGGVYDLGDDGGGLFESPFDKLSPEMQERATKAKDFVSETAARMSEAAQTAQNPADFLRSVFGNGLVDEAVVDLSPDTENPSVMNAEDPMEAMSQREETRQQRAERYAFELMADENTPESVISRLESFNGDFSSPEAQAYAASRLVAQRGGEKLANMASDLIEAMNELGAKTKASGKDALSQAAEGVGEFAGKARDAITDRIVKNNLMGTTPTEQAAFNKIVYDNLTDEAKGSAYVRGMIPQLANTLLAYAARTGDLTPADMKVISRVQEGMQLFADPEAAAAQIAEYAGIPFRAEDSFLSRIKRISNAQNDNIDHNNSFLRMSLTDEARAGLTNAQIGQVAKLVDTFTMRDDGGPAAAAILKGLEQAFGSPEATRAVLDYYAQQNRADLRYDESEALTDDFVEDASGVNDFASEYDESEALAGGHMSEKNAKPSASYQFADPTKRIPFRNFVGRMANKGGMRRNYGEASLAADAIRSQSPDGVNIEPISMAQYVRETDGIASYEVKRIAADIERRIEIHKDKGGREKQINELLGELELMRAAYREGGYEGVLDLYTVNKVDGKEMDDTIATDEDLNRMAQDAQRGNAREGKVTFQFTDGSTRAFSASQMWKVWGDREGAGSDATGSERAKQLFASAMAAVQARPDVVGVVPKGMKKIPEAPAKKSKKEEKAEKARVKALTPAERNKEISDKARERTYGGLESVKLDPYNKVPFIKQANADYRAEVRAALKAAESSMTKFDAMVSGLATEFLIAESVDSGSDAGTNKARGKKVSDRIDELLAKLGDDTTAKPAKKKAADSLRKMKAEYGAMAARVFADEAVKAARDHQAALEEALGVENAKLEDLVTERISTEASLGSVSAKADRENLIRRLRSLEARVEEQRGAIKHLSEELSAGTERRAIIKDNINRRIDALSTTLDEAAAGRGLLAKNVPAQAIARQKLRGFRKAMGEISAIELAERMDEADNNREGMVGLEEDTGVATGPLGENAMTRSQLNRRLGDNVDARTYEEDTGEAIGSSKQIFNSKQKDAQAIMEGKPRPLDTKRVVLSGKGPYVAKDQVKSDKANRFIGQGSASSSTAKYAKDWGNRANSGREYPYNEHDRVFVSAEGVRKGRVEPNFVELRRATDAGATIITDAVADRSRPYNKGERQVAGFLAEQGYVESEPGIWKPEGGVTDEMRARNEALAEAARAAWSARSARPEPSVKFREDGKQSRPPASVKRGKGVPPPKLSTPARTIDAVMEVLHGQFSRLDTPAKVNTFFDRAKEIYDELMTFTQDEHDALDASDPREIVKYVGGLFTKDNRAAEAVSKVLAHAVLSETAAAHVSAVTGLDVTADGAVSDDISTVSPAAKPKGKPEALSAVLGKGPRQVTVSQAALDALYDVAVSGNRKRLDTPEKVVRYAAMARAMLDQLSSISADAHTKQTKALLTALKKEFEGTAESTSKWDAMLDDMKPTNEQRALLGDIVNRKPSDLKPRRGRPGQFDRQAIVDEIRRLRGDAVRVAFDTFGNIKGSGQFSMNRDGTDRLITIAVNAVDHMGVARHEALHDFFSMLSSMNPRTRSIKRDLVQASYAPHVNKRLRELLKDEEKALRQIEANDEERVAYMYQFWAEGLINLGPTGTTIFQRLKQLFHDLTGILSAEQRAQDLLVELHEGRFAEPSTVAEVLADMPGDRFRNKMEIAAPALTKALEVVFSVGPDRLRSFQNDSLNELADLYSSEKGELGMIQRRFRQQGLWDNRLATILEGTTAAERRAAVNNLQAMRDPSNELERGIAKFLSDMHDYMNEAGIASRAAGNSYEPLRRVAKYFPRTFDRNKIRDNQAAFEALLMEHSDMDAAQARATATALIHGNGQLDLVERENSLGYTPFAAAVIDRKLKFINPENAAAFAAYQTKDLMDIMSSYIKQAVHKGENTRAFGQDGEVVTRLVEQSGISDRKDLKFIQNTIKGLDGSLGNEMSTATKEMLSTIMTLQNLVVLPLAIFSQAVDPIIMAARSGDVKDAGRAFVAGAKSIMGKQVDGEEMATMMGIVAQDSVLEAMGNAYGTAHMTTRMQKINKTFFKWNGMQAWNNGMRIAATAAGERYLIANQSDGKALAELGLKPGDVRVKPDGRLDTESQKIQEAMYRFVDQAVLRPSASNRPTWMSDPRFILVGHLKQFTFAMHNVMLKRAGKELRDGNPKPWATLMLAMPTILAADMVKFMATGGGPSSWGFMDYMKHMVERSGLLGLGDFGAQAMHGVNRGGMPGEQLLGPAFEHLMEILRWIGGDPRTDLGDVVDRTVPGARFL